MSETDPSATGTPTDSPDAPSADSAASAPIPDLGYEQAREELIEVVRRLESGGTTLEESLALWERGEALARTCQHWLDGARQRLDAATERSGAEG